MASRGGCLWRPQGREARARREFQLREVEERRQRGPAAVLVAARARDFEFVEEAVRQRVQGLDALHGRIR